MTASVALSSSLRSSPPEVTLEHARIKAAELGISRVTDITRLDRVGVPVYASIRPTAIRGSLCVNAGKGLRPIEAEVGAYMEAIELALAEPGRSKVSVVSATARDVLDGRVRDEAILDLCPLLGVDIDLDAPMDCVFAEEVTSGERALLPAELVFVPFEPQKGNKTCFSTSSNGLASGNTVEEATLHGLLELVERDIRSFQGIADTSVLVDVDTVSGPAGELVRTIREAGLELFVRSAPNDFDVTYLTATINDPDSLAPHLLNGGNGCHPHASVAFVRAVSEAAQSRLSYIHGGRDDLVETNDRFRFWNKRKKREFVERVVGRASRGPAIPFSQLTDHSKTEATVAGCLRHTMNRLSSRGLRRVYRVCFSEPTEALQVVRVIVPGLEFFSDGIPRVGPRLRAHASLC